MKKRLLALVLGMTMAVSLLAGCGSKETEQETAAPAASQGEDAAPTEGEDTAPAETGSSDGVYKIALSNSYMENGWRQEMEAVAEMVAATDEYKAKCVLDIYNTDNTVEAQVASLESLIEMDYDAIIIDCCSESGLNTTIDAAVDKGIVVVTFDSNSTSEKAYSIAIDSSKSYALTSTVIAESIGGAGNVVVDRGISSTSTSKGIYDTAMGVFNSYPDIKVVAEFDGEFNEGTIQNEFSTLLATNDVDACFTQSHSTAIINACKDAGIDPVPCNGDTYNSNVSANAKNNVIGAFTPWYVGMSVMAMDTAIAVLNGETVEQHVVIAPDILVVDGGMDMTAVDAASKEIGVGYKIAEEGVDYSSEWPDQFLWPVLPKDYPVQVDAQDLVDFMASK
ncbi:MAG: substrate-binding domain-containing protein [Lachnospiraceae bacterium]|nr:substrate-binding domain-containing protein [Lachnospiraceae bacterium]